MVHHITCSLHVRYVVCSESLNVGFQHRAVNKLSDYEVLSDEPRGFGSVESLFSSGQLIGAREMLVSVIKVVRCQSLAAAVAVDLASLLSSPCLVYSRRMVWTEVVNDEAGEVNVNTGFVPHPCTVLPLFPSRLASISRFYTRFYDLQLVFCMFSVSALV